MDNLVFDEICDFQYRFLFSGADADRHCACGIMLLFSLILGTVALFQKIGGIALEGFTTVIIIQLFTGSIIMMSLGIIGYYIARIYDEIKGRPRYIISKKCGYDK